MRKGLEAEAEKINQQAAKNNLPMVRLMPYVAGDGDAGIERQIMQMQELIAQKVLIWKLKFCPAELGITI